MTIFNKINQWHAMARNNRWFYLFTWFNRIALATGFIIAGTVKVIGERFASGLSTTHPMGAYLEALHHTGYYYTFVGLLQIIAALLLLIPRTATLGALLYFPIIVNICVLSFALRFDGSLISSSIMVLSNLYLLCWDYQKLKIIYSVEDTSSSTFRRWKDMSKKIPLKFAIGSTLVMVLIILLVGNAYHIKPYNNLTTCQNKCTDHVNPKACLNFCECIHIQGNHLNICLEAYEEITQSN